jgi:hypothetical protein
MKAGQAVLVAILAALIVGSVMYVYMQTYATQQYQTGYSAGYSAGSAAAPSVTPVSLSLTQVTSTFDFSANVSSDGSATANESTAILTIENDDDSAASIIITAENPKTGTDGIPSGLENAYFNVWAGSLSLQKYLFTDGDYTSGAAMTIDADSVVNVYIGCELETAPSGTFADNQTYTMHIYVYQPNANYVQELTYTVLT